MVSPKVNFSGLEKPDISIRHNDKKFKRCQTAPSYADVCPIVSIDPCYLVREAHDSELRIPRKSTLCLEKDATTRLSIISARSGADLDFPCASGRMSWGRTASFFSFNYDDQEGFRIDAPVIEQPSLLGSQAPVIERQEEVCANIVSVSSSTENMKVSKGSALHGSGNCVPCSFFRQRKGCEFGVNCDFCHVCSAGDCRRHRKKKATARKIQKEQEKANFATNVGFYHQLRRNERNQKENVVVSLTLERFI